MIKKLIIAALLTEIFSPILIWKAGLPSAFRWISAGSVFLVIVIGLIQMLRRNKVPWVLILVLALILIGVVQAFTNGGSPTSILWGIWQMFKYPLLGIIVSQQEDFSSELTKKVYLWGFLLLMVQIIVQLLQYIFGETDPDQLAGTFSQYRWGGTTPLVLVLIFISCLFLCRWIVSNKSMSVIIVFLLASFSSVLGELKIFFPVYFSIVIISLIFLIIYKKWRKIFSLLILVGLFFCTLQLLQNKPINTNLTFDVNNAFDYSRYLDPEVFYKYFNTTQQWSSDAGFTPGRNYYITQVVRIISHDPVTLWFGMGIGAQSESKTLGTVGSAIQQGDLGNVSGTSLTVLLGEYGILGIISFALSVILILINLAALSRSSNSPNHLGLINALFVFSLFWPIWVWYSSSWILGAPMIIYWTLLGYIFQQQNKKSLEYKI